MEINIRKLMDFVGSRSMFLLTMVIFILETCWLSITTRFPMAFDEAYHFGLIRYFSHHLNPVITSQGGGTYVYGAIIQDPSFMYHYLMSFPYRVIEVFTTSYETQVIILRLLNVVLAVLTLLVLKKILEKLQLSSVLTNTLLLIFALTPIFTALSAQINYDNLLILASSMSIYVTICYVDDLKNNIFNLKKLLILLCLCLFTSLVKFAFLPILIAIVGIIIWRIIVFQKTSKTRLFVTIKKSFKSMSTATRVALVAISIVFIGLFSRFYVVNVVRYHNPVPQCNQVLAVKDCTQYYAWDSNYNILQNHLAHPKPNSLNIVKYFASWLLLIFVEMFGEIKPLYGLFYVSVVFIVILCIIGSTSLMCTIVNIRSILRKNIGLQTVSIITFIYLLSLWARNYHDYLQLGQPVAIDARYFLPVSMYLFVLLGLGLQATLNSIGAYANVAKALSVMVIIITFLIFGGFSQYITQVTPNYGHISPRNRYTLSPT